LHRRVADQSAGAHDVDRNSVPIHARVGLPVRHRPVRYVAASPDGVLVRADRRDRAELSRTGLVSPGGRIARASDRTDPRAGAQTDSAARRIGLFADSRLHDPDPRPRLSAARDLHESADVTARRRTRDALLLVPRPLLY